MRLILKIRGKFQVRQYACVFSTLLYSVLHPRVQQCPSALPYRARPIASCSLCSCATCSQMGTQGRRARCEFAFYDTWWSRGSLRCVGSVGPFSGASNPQKSYRMQHFEKNSLSSTLTLVRFSFPFFYFFMTYQFLRFANNIQPSPVIRTLSGLTEKWSYSEVGLIARLQ